MHSRVFAFCKGGVAILLVCICVLPAAARRHRGTGQPGDVARVTTEKSGNVPTRSGLRLRASSDLANFHVFTDSTNEVRYRIRIAVNAREADAAEVAKRFLVTARATESGVQILSQLNPRDAHADVRVDCELHVPRNYSLDLSTGAGNIDTQDISGKLVLVTGGGNITVGQVGDLSREGGDFSARLETQGGHIVVGDVAGDLHASTAGGHITAGDIGGDAELHTGGGHIRVGSIGGDAQLETGGGNILIGVAGGDVSASTGGGQISFGEVSGSLHAHTSGGAIRIARSTGPTQVESSRGSIVLTDVKCPLRASTSFGTITAWFSGDESGSDEEDGAAAQRSVRRGVAPSELNSMQGDIVVYLPRGLGISIDAIVAQGGSSHIVADPDIPIKISYPEAAGAGPVRAECELNGGGEVLHLRALSGNIVLKMSDAQSAFRVAAQEMNELREQIDAQTRMLAQGDSELPMDGPAPPEASQPPEPPAPPASAEQAESRFDQFEDRLEEMFWGGVEVAPDEQQKKLVRKVEAVYPDVARQAGVEGTVVLNLVIGKDGAVQGVKLLSGDPVLAQAAMDAVEHWRYAPTIVDGRPVNVLTSVSIEFHLQ